MADVEQYAKDLADLVAYSLEFQNKVNKACGGSFKWGIEQVVDSYLSMFDRFCPYNIGDAVFLSKDALVDEDSGWWHCRHFLKKGERAVVKSRGYSKGQFSFDIEFDNETWIDRNGDKQPVSRKHTFSFRESSLTSTNQNDVDKP